MRIINHSSSSFGQCYATLSFISSGIQWIISSTSTGLRISVLQFGLTIVWFSCFLSTLILVSLNFKYYFCQYIESLKESFFYILWRDSLKMSTLRNPSPEPHFEGILYVPFSHFKGSYLNLQWRLSNMLIFSFISIERFIHVIVSLG